MIFVAINCEDMEDLVYENIIKNDLDGDEDRWDEEEWGFYDELSFKSFDGSIFDDVEETGIETIISKSSKNFTTFFEYASKNADVYFDENSKEVYTKEWIEIVNSLDNCTISICECSPN